MWRRFLTDKGIFFPVELDGTRVRVLADLSLEFSNAWRKDSAIYFCLKGIEIMAKYSLDVVRLEPHRYVSIKFLPFCPEVSSTCTVF